MDRALENHHLGTSIQIVLKSFLPMPLVEALAARFKLAAGQTEETFDIYQAALQIFLWHRALIYDYADALLRSSGADKALKFVSR